MRFIKSILCAFVLTFFAFACSSQKPLDGVSPSPDVVSPSPSDTHSQYDNSSPYMEECYMPLCFDSDEQFLNVLEEVRMKRTSGKDTVVVESEMYGEQPYSSKSDIFKMTGISEFYKPMYVPRDLSYEGISFKAEYVTFKYANDDQTRFANFTWFREMPPDVAMNVYGIGAISEREIVDNGIEYVILEWYDRENEKTGGYSIFWVCNGKAYKASISDGYSDDEMLKFCEFETIAVN